MSNAFSKGNGASGFFGLIVQAMAARNTFAVSASKVCSMNRSQSGHFAEGSQLYGNAKVRRSFGSWPGRRMLVFRSSVPLLNAARLVPSQSLCWR